MFWFFNKDKIPKEIYNPYTIKFFPIKKVYVVMYNGNYLDTNPSTWFIRQWSYPELWWEHWAEIFHSEEDARKYIQQHKEQTSEYVLIKP